MLIRQRFKADCVVASVAMYCKVPYEKVVEVLESLKIKPSNLGGNDTLRAMKQLGHVNVTEKLEFYDFLPCILSVPSLNNKGRMHAVYWDGERIWDPQEGNEGMEFYTTEFLYANQSWAGGIVDMSSIGIRD